LIELLKQERRIVAFQTHEQQEVLAYWELYYTVQDFLKDNATTLLKAGSETDYAIANRIAQIIRQYATYIAQDEFLLQSALRDQFSLRNVNWCLDQLGTDSKIAIWAHNGHVAKKAVQANYDILGYYLSEWFGDAYYSIGFTFNSGTFGAFSNNGFGRWELPPVETPSLTQALSQYNSPFLLFDLRSNLKVVQDRPKSPLSQAMPTRTDLSEFYREGQPLMMSINLSNSYDCLIYMEEIHCPTTIEWQR